MKGRYLEVTFRRGRPFAAYLYLPRKVGDKSARTVRMGHGLLVDYRADGSPIGVEITAPMSTNAAAINEVLLGLGLDIADPDELAPLRAA